MPDLNNKFQAGKMNKDLDERLVPNGEYRDALNIEVATSEGSDMGSAQTIMGNINLSNLSFGRVVSDGYCVASIVNEKTDKLYWFISGNGQDIIAEYDYHTKAVVPVMVDMFTPGTIAGNESGRALNFDPSFLITGINIIDDIIFWTDNNTEPKRVNIERGKMGSPNFNTQTQFYVRNTLATIPNSYIPIGPVRHEHLTVIKKSPPVAPVLEMKSFSRFDVDGDGTPGEISTTITTSQNPFQDPDTGEYWESAFTITFDTSPDFQIGDYIIISFEDKEIRAVIEPSNFNIPGDPGPSSSCDIIILSGDQGLLSTANTFDVILVQPEPLFKFKFPRFAYRYKYEDGEYSSFSPFTEVAFLPGDFDYLPKEGYNLGMVNMLRDLAVRDFVHGRLLPDDVISIDILYKESNSPNIYSVKTIKRRDGVSTTSYDEWNAASSTTIDTGSRTRGFVRITSEMIHAVLPSNQLLRPWDNVPRKALAQEVVGNRIVYGNYLQNYNLSNRIPSYSLGIKYNRGGSVVKAQDQIDIDLKLTIKSRQLGTLQPEQYNPWHAVFGYSPAKSIKTLRTYQLGVVYRDEFGRETPVFSDSKSDRASLYLDKNTADQSTRLKAQVFNNHPSFAKSFKFFIKETSNEYYNLAMDRWYDAEDGNIWITFPSAERNKIDEDTFLILKKEHDYNVAVLRPARYKVIAIENEAPTFVKTQKLPQGVFFDAFSAPTGSLIGGNQGGVGWPNPGTNRIDFDQAMFEQLGWAGSGGTEGKLYQKDLSVFKFRVKTPTGRSNWYTPVSCELDTTIGNGFYIVKIKDLFKEDMAITSATGTWAGRHLNMEIELIKEEVRNKPEFEGRFFVKILKDLEIIKSIIHPSTTGTSYLALYSIVSQYINPTANIPLGHSSDYANAWVGDWYGVPANPASSSDLQKLSISDKNNPPGATHADEIWGVGPAGTGQAYWDLASKSTSNNSSGWFIDKIEGFRRFKHTKELFGNDNSFVTNSHDLSTFLVSKPDLNPKIQLQLIGTNTPGSGTSSNYLGIAGVVHPLNTLRDASVGVGGEIVPSNGIDPTTGIIHLSFSGVGGEDTGSGNAPTGLSGIEHHFNALGWANQHSTDAAFINAITTPGTIWRWEEDPGQTVYVTKAYTATTPYTSQEWQANYTDTFDGELGTALFNYSKFSDYIIDNHHWVQYEYWFTCVPFCCPCMVSQTGQLQTRFWVSASIANHENKCWIPLCDTNLKVALMANSYWAADHVDSSVLTSSSWSSGLWGSTGAHNKYPMMTQDWGKYINKRRRFQFMAESYEVDPATDAPYGLGQVPPHNYLPTNDPMLPPHLDHTGTPLTAVSSPVLPSTVAPGIRPDGMYTGHNLPGGGSYSIDDGVGTVTSYNTIPKLRMEDTSGNRSPEPGSVTWTILDPWAGPDEDTIYSSKNPAIWETEPKEDVGLEIYHEVGQIYPIELDDTNIEQFVGAIHSDIKLNPRVTCWNPHPTTGGWNKLDTDTTGGLLTAFVRTDIRVVSAVDNEVLLTDINGVLLDGLVNPNQVIPIVGDRLIFTRSDGSSTEAEVVGVGNTATNAYTLSPYVHNFEATLPWFNCYSFGNGVESDRIRDDFNQVTIDNGPKASTTLEEPYAEERRASGLIYSGIYNSMSGINNLNQFIQAEKITKDLNPVYGSIQKLHTRNTNLLTLCEDKVFKILANKDALYNADGKINLTATENVLGQTTPLLGEFGISTNPESFAFESYRTYFSDKTRGVVVRLSQDGMTPISDVGMKDYFGDRLILSNRIIGSFDDKKEEYNITLGHRDFPITIPPIDKGVWEVNIEGASKSGAPPFHPTGSVFCGQNVPISVGNLVVGPGIPPNAIVTNVTNLGGGQGVKVTFNQTLQAWRDAGTTLGAIDGGTLVPPGITYSTVFWHSEVTIFTNANNVIQSTYTNVVGTACEEEWIVGGPTTGSNQTVIRPYFNNGNLPSTISPNGVVGGTVVTDVSCDCDQSHTASNPCTDACAFLDVGTYGGTFFQWHVGDIVKMPSGRVWKKIQGSGTPNWIGPMSNPERPDGVGSEYWEECCEHDYGCGDVTISFSEISKGWSSFKSFIQEDGVSLNNTYYTFNGGDLYEHAANNLRNNFYNQQFDSSITTLFNKAAGSVKSFQTLNYEGTQSKITVDTTSSGEYWDNEQQFGWYVNKMHTNLQQVGELQFKNKEGKWFAQIQGETTEWLDDGEAGNIDVTEFAYQGIDEAGAIDIITGGYTSWECSQANPCTGECGERITAQSTGSFVHPVVHPDWLMNAVNYFFENPTHSVDDYKFHIYDNSSIIPPQYCVPCESNPDYVDGSYNYYKKINNLYVTLSPGTYTNFTLTGQTSYSFKTVNDAIDFLISELPGAGFNYGVTFFQLNSTLSNACPGGDPNACAVTTAGGLMGDPGCCGGVISDGSEWNCIQIEGLSGTYATESECLTDPSTPCGLSAPTWSCCDPNNPPSIESPHYQFCHDTEGGVLEWTCYDPGDGSGDHSTLEECQQACFDPCTQLNSLTVTTIDATNTNGCADGTVTVGVTLLNGASQWDFIIEDPLGGIFYTDTNNPYIGNTSTVPYVQVPGGFGYVAVVIDDLGCRSEIPFTIGCVNAPCPDGPYHSAAGPGTSPHNSYFGAYHPTASGACEDGIAWANMLVFGNGTTWTVDWYSVPPMGAPILIWDDPTVYVATDVSSNQLSNLPDGNYQYTVTDDLGCIYTYSFTLTCTGVPCDGPNNIDWSMTETPIVSSDCEQSPHAPPTISAPGNVTLTVNGFQTLASGNYDVTWKNLDGTVLGTNPGIAIGVAVMSPSLTPTASQLSTGPDAPCVNGACVTGGGGSCTPQNPTSLLNAWKFVMEITDSDGCLSVLDFCVPCSTQALVPVLGCIDFSACNWDPLANTDDGSCCYEGCQDPLATNYDPAACCAGTVVCIYDTSEDLRYDCSGFGVDWGGQGVGDGSDGIPINTPPSGVFGPWEMMDYGPNHIANNVYGNYNQNDIDDGHFPPKVNPPLFASGPGQSGSTVPQYLMRQRAEFYDWNSNGPIPPAWSGTMNNPRLLFFDLTQWHAGGMAKQPCSDPCRGTASSGPPQDSGSSAAYAMADPERPWTRNMPEVKVVQHDGFPYVDGAAEIFKPGGANNPTNDINIAKRVYPFIEVTNRIEEAVINEKKGFPQAMGSGPGPYNQVPDMMPGTPCGGLTAQPECTGLAFDWAFGTWSTSLSSVMSPAIKPYISWYLNPQHGYPKSVGGDNHSFPGGNTTGAYGGAPNGLATAGRFPIGHNWSGSNTDFLPTVDAHWQNWAVDPRNNPRPPGSQYGFPNDHIMLWARATDTGYSASNNPAEFFHNEGAPSWGIPYYPAPGQPDKGINNPLGGYSDHVVNHPVATAYPYNEITEGWPASGYPGFAPGQFHLRCGYNFYFIINPWFTSLEDDV